MAGTGDRPAAWKEGSKTPNATARVVTDGWVIYCAVFALSEGWPSGLRRTLGKRVYGKPYRGFESRPLRQYTIAN